MGEALHWPAPAAGHALPCKSRIWFPAKPPYKQRQRTCLPFLAGAAFFFSSFSAVAAARCTLPPAGCEPMHSAGRACDGC